jgi:hypothetical protein
MLHIVYRSYGGENAKGRPAFYSKALAMASVLRAAEELAGAAEIVFLNDGPIPDDLLRIMERSGEVDARAQMGMKGSLRAALKLPAERGWSKDDLVWFSEDDYLYQPHAFTGLRAAASAFPDAAYFALYALIGTRLPNGASSDDKHVPVGCPKVPVGWHDTEPTPVLGHPWRRALSTTSTFGARVGALDEERLLMYATMWSGAPWDYTMCLLYQGFQPYSLAETPRWLREQTRAKGVARTAAMGAVRLALSAYQAARGVTGHSGRLFVSPDPALATHLESKYMALGTDWDAVAEDTARWGRERGLL